MQSTCGRAPPLVAYCIAGLQRSFLDDHSTLIDHLIRPFGGAAESCVFLLLKNATKNTSFAVANLRDAPVAAVEADVQLHTPGTDTMSLPRLNEQCFPGKWQKPRYIATYHPVWTNMQTMLDRLSAWEVRHGRRFDVVVYTRPDVRFLSSFGPWCTHASGTWISDETDHLWILPRAHAQLVLTTLRSATRCTRGMTCCEAGRHSRGASWYPHEALANVVPQSHAFGGYALIRGVRKVVTADDRLVSHPQAEKLIGGASLEDAARQTQLYLNGRRAPVQLTPLPSSPASPQQFPFPPIRSAMPAQRHAVATAFTMADCSPSASEAHGSSLLDANGVLPLPRLVCSERYATLLSCGGRQLLFTRRSLGDEHHRRFETLLRVKPRDGSSGFSDPTVTLDTRLGMSHNAAFTCAANGDDVIVFGGLAAHARKGPAQSSRSRSHATKQPAEPGSGGFGIMRASANALTLPLRWSRPTVVLTGSPRRTACIDRRRKVDGVCEYDGKLSVAWLGKSLDGTRELLLYARFNLEVAGGARHAGVARSRDEGRSWGRFEPIALEGYKTGIDNNLYFFTVTPVEPNASGTKRPRLIALFPAVIDGRGGVYRSMSTDGIRWSVPERLLTSAVHGHRTGDYPIDGAESSADLRAGKHRLLIEHNVDLRGNRSTHSHDTDCSVMPLVCEYTAPLSADWRPTMAVAPLRSSRWYLSSPTQRRVVASSSESRTKQTSEGAHHRLADARRVRHRSSRRTESRLLLGRATPKASKVYIQHSSVHLATTNSSHAAPGDVTTVPSITYWLKQPVSDDTWRQGLVHADRSTASYRVSRRPYHWLNQSIWRKYIRSVYADLPEDSATPSIEGLDLLYNRHDVLRGVAVASGCAQHSDQPSWRFNHHAPGTPLRDAIPHMTRHTRIQPHLSPPPPPPMLPMHTPLVAYLMQRMERDGPHPALPDQAWAEVTHCGGSEHEVHGAFFYVMRGSGIFVNVGRTIAFLTHRDAAVHFLGSKLSNEARGFPRTGCEGGKLVDRQRGIYQCDVELPRLAAVARAAGFDSIQYTQHCDAFCANGPSTGGGRQQCGHELVLLGASGTAPCPPGIEFRAGLGASRPCRCVSSDASEAGELRGLLSPRGSACTVCAVRVQ